jgi:Cdc6-like AAA superfamily ATPase
MFHNSQERFPPPKCHPDTRKRILNDLMTLITWDLLPPILWLYGPAGAGKSAIAQSIAERCEEENPKRLASSFFFSRRTSDRNSEKHLVATISYQLAVNLPKTKPIIEEIVENDPLVFSRSVKVQLQNLVVEPLRRVSKEYSPHRFIIIDGLDECNGDANQCSILYAIHEAVSGQRLPISFLIASRPEPHIRNFFNNNLFKLSQHIPLTQNSESRNDVKIFLRKEFKRICKDRGLSTTWPSYQDIQTLAEKASGHFIYPSTVIRFIDDPRHYPPMVHVT